MKKTDAWKAKVADLKKYAEESLHQMEDDKEYLLKLLKDLDETIELLQRNSPASTIRIVKLSSMGPTMSPKPAGKFRPQYVIRGKRIDPQQQLANHKKRIPTYRSVINRFEQIGTLLKTSLKRISEAEALMR